jgi:predicted double-glycine peptidase
MRDIGLIVHNINITDSSPLFLDNDEEVIYKYKVSMGKNVLINILTRYEVYDKFEESANIILNIEHSLEMSIKRLNL